MKEKKTWFALSLSILIVCMSAFLYSASTTLTVRSFSEKETIQNNLELPLEQLAVAQARILDPTYQWLGFQQDYPPEVQNAILEAALGSQKAIGFPLANSSPLSTDSNLAWKIRYKDREYEHNWILREMDAQAILNVTFENINGQMHALQHVEGMAQPSMALFDNWIATVLNSNLETGSLSQSQDGSTPAGKEYFYDVRLPADFSIQFYIPADLQANGGMIAQYATELQQMRFFMLYAAACIVLLLFVLLWNKQIEVQAPVFRRLIQMKALGCWLALGAGLAFCTFLAFSIITAQTCGLLAENLYAMGLSSLYPNVLAKVLTFLSWVLLLFVTALALMYLKYMFAFGFFRYLKEDTLMAGLVKNSAGSFEKMVQIPLNEWTWTRLLPFLLFGALLYGGAAAIGWYLGDGFGLAVLLLILSLLLLAAGRRLYVLIHKDYLNTLSAANELAEGNFSNIQPRQVGPFQNLYDDLIDIKDGFQSALKDGLTNQNMKTELISNVSHDLKTPVTGIKSYAELITLSENLEDIHQYSARLQNYTDRLSALIEDLFDVARASSGDIRLEPVQLDLGQLIEQVESEWADAFAKRQITPVLDLPSASPATLDPDKTVRIIDNLLSNIHKYTMEGTRVFISLQEIPGQYVVVFKNISKAPLDFSGEEITERFVRGDRSRHEPGSGLGLAIVKSFMEVQNGTCTIDIDGDVFKAILVFPIVKPEPKPAPFAEVEAESENKDGKQKQLLQSN